MSAAWLTFAGVVFTAVCGLGGILAVRYLDNRAIARMDAQKKLEKEQAAKNEERRVDREEFDSITRELRANYSNLAERFQRSEMDREAADLRAARAEARAAKSDERAAEFEERALASDEKSLRLEGRISMLEQTMIANSVTVPPNAM